MARYCSDCTYLKVDDKGNGKYKCTKIKKDMFANTPACDKFGNAYARRSYDKEKYYDLAKAAQNKTNSDPGMLMLVAILLAIAVIILNIFM